MMLSPSISERTVDFLEGNGTVDDEEERKTHVGAVLAPRQLAIALRRT